jgi:hypothetical protein
MVSVHKGYILNVYCVGFFKNVLQYVLLQAVANQWIGYKCSEGENIFNTLPLTFW